MVIERLLNLFVAVVVVLFLCWPYSLPSTGLMSIIRRLIIWAAYGPRAVLTAQPQLDDQARQPIPVTGMTTGINNRTGERPARQEINILQNEGGPPWDLYIQGLAALQNKTETDELSHFSIAGIHGLPHAPFNGVGPVPGGSGGGFCPHGETQFVSWHRPYVALFEQVLGAEVQRIAAQYSDHQNVSAYRDAGRVFRLPYWDWVLNPRLPPSCAQENITVNGPLGSLTIRNPLYSYRWQTYPLNQTQFPGSANWPGETTRASDGKSDFSLEVVNANIAAVAHQLRDQVYHTFANASTYDQMSSMADPAGISFEASHNLIHNAVGGSFASIDMTAFDSLFMLHHTNLDRLAAVWAAIHPNATYQSRSYSSGGLYAQARGENITAESPVKPFYRADGKSFHTGISVASLHPFGYTYPELTELGSQEKTKGREAVISRINALYGGNCSVDDTYLRGEEWFVKITANRSELELPCNIDVYVGGTFAGRMALLEMPTHGLAHAEIPLQRAVRDLGSSTTDRAATGRVLLQQLRVRIEKDNGFTTDAKNIASTELKLAAMDVIHRSSESELIKYGNKSVYTGILLD
ncbi:Di-copper centre-containing protein [Jackrogersella minutella]|nr:Di-copper centre-containing protein [Jackrogersella minutella]